MRVCSHRGTTLDVAWPYMMRKKMLVKAEGSRIRSLHGESVDGKKKKS